ncbi:RCC1 domain-containing protein [Bdellovibrio svalbardensis]|uniref:RCC1-like domain-containing protein n=1 Tax=Bdellovibrio svalbardensis TaxID=2972972 RepID=A0ABT6DHF0_9BACT|nr:hypothetical protein [Bdellovibrio svalbardensis]MDG0815897.1 hypothetical protein [Bdellovibrio svalbardensis]
MQIGIYILISTLWGTLNALAGGVLPAAMWNQQKSLKVKQVSVGSNHVCTLLENSKVKCWGYNANGQLGLENLIYKGDGAGEMGDSLAFVNLGTGRSAVQIAGGGMHTCALLDNSTVKCWGEGSSGQLGQGNGNSLGWGGGQMGDSLPAINLGTGRSAVQITAGYSHACALLDNSTVKCWGEGSSGQLGIGSTAKMGDGAGEMGDSLPAINLGTGRRAVQISAGYSHTCALLDNSTVKCWGNNGFGQLGQGSTTNLGDGAGEMGDSLPAINLGTGRSAVRIIAGYYHTCALLDDSTVKCWGYNSTGHLGQGSTSTLGDGAGEMGDSLPAISLGTGRKAVQVALGNQHTCALLDNSTVKCWGDNSFGQLGQGNSTTLGDGAGEMGDSLPVINLGTGRAAVQISSSGNHVCALLDNSTVKCWGSNNYGQLGQGHTANLGDGAGEMGDSLQTIKLGMATSRLAKVFGGKFSKVSQLVSGPFSVCAILENSKLKCWGRNDFGQLGQGNTLNLGDSAGETGDSLPYVDLGTGRTAVQVAVGDSHTCAILDNAAVKCWGKNNYGQLGQGNTNNLGDGAGEMGDSLPTIDLGTGRSAKQIGVGLEYSCALLDNSTVKCWGVNFLGQLGQGHTNNLGDGVGEMGDSLAAINFGTGRSVVQLAVGSQFSCVILDNGALKCWGVNSSGQLGLGTSQTMGDGPGEMGDSLPVVNLGTGRSAVQVSLGGADGCALLDNSTVKCWGYNFDGELGQGHTNNLGDGAGEMGDSLPAINLGTGRSAVQIASGGYLSCALLDNSTMKCWGSNAAGGLGQESTANLGDGAGEMGDSLPAISLGTGRSAISISAGSYHACAVLDNATVKCWGQNGYGQMGQGNTTVRGDQAGEMGDNLSIVNLGTSK